MEADIITLPESDAIRRRHGFDRSSGRHRRAFGVSMIDQVVPTTPAIDKAQKANRLWVVAAVVLSGLTLIVSLGLTALRYSDAAKQSTAAQASNRVLQSADRADCRANYNTSLTDVIRARDAVSAQAQLDLAAYLLGNPASDSSKLAQDRLTLQNANNAVLALPRLGDAIQSGFVLNGVRYPPCPKVR